MPTPIRPIARPIAATAKAGSIVTGSLNDITKMIEEHKTMIDTIQDVADPQCRA